MKIILDVDYDFFFNNEHSISTYPWKKYDTNPEEFYKLHSDYNFIPVMQHDEALMKWDNDGLFDTVCVHFDHHHDLYIDLSNFFSLKAGHRLTGIHCGNYLAHAIKDGIIRQLIWVYPDNKILPSIPDKLEKFLKKYVTISVISYSQYIRDWYPRIIKFDVVSAISALSPDFVPARFFKDFYKFHTVDQEFKKLSAEFAFKSILLGTFPSNARRFSNVYITPRLVRWFYGSLIKNLKVLNPNNGKLHISSSQGFASSYALSLKNKHSWILGIEHIGHRQECIYLYVPPEKNHELNLPFSLYSTNITEDLIATESIISAYDHVVFKQLQVKDEIEFRTVRQMLKDFGVKLYSEQIFSGKKGIFKLIEQNIPEFSTWINLTWSACLSLPFIPFYILLFITRQKGINYSAPFFPLIHWENWISRELLPEVKRVSPLTDEGSRSLSECLEFTINSIILAYAENKNPIIAVFASCFQYIINSQPDNLKNSYESVKLLRQLLVNSWKDYGNNLWTEYLADLSYYNDDNKLLPNSIAILTRDADRIKLAWEHGYQAKNFFTKTGNTLAKLGSIHLDTVRSLLTFSDCSYIEFNIRDGKTIITLWNSGCRFIISKEGEPDFEDLTCKVSTYNVNKLILNPGTEFLQEQVCKFAIVMNLNVSLVLSYKREQKDLTLISCSNSFIFEEIFIDLGVIKNTIEIDWLRNFKFQQEKQLNWNYLIEITHNNCPWILRKIIALIKLGINIIPYRKNRSQNDILCLTKSDHNKIAKSLIKFKKEDENAIELRLRGNISWCSIQNYQLSFTIFEPRVSNWVPYHSDSDIVELDNLFLKLKQLPNQLPNNCNSCPYLFNCLGGESYPLRDGFPVLANTELMEKWKPYKL
jgi:hypothetical protein